MRAIPAIAPSGGAYPEGERDDNSLNDHEPCAARLRPPMLVKARPDIRLEPIE